MKNITLFTLFLVVNCFFVQSHAGEKKEDSSSWNVLQLILRHVDFKNTYWGSPTSSPQSSPQSSPPPSPVKKQLPRRSSQDGSTGTSSAHNRLVQQLTFALSDGVSSPKKQGHQ